uniref:FtsQ-type POTRA domain-containing protein n=1 Tax=candidate division WOR-3 bacterium TaxID=2052148 RepID=A0A7C4YG62_UNCW3
MSVKKIMKIIIILFFFSFILFIPGFFIPIKKVYVFGGFFESKKIMNKKIYAINSSELKKEIMKDESIKETKIIKFPYGILFIIIKKREPVAYYIENGILKCVEKNGFIFKTDEKNKRMKFLKGNKERIVEGIELMKILKNVDTIYLGRDGPITKLGNFEILWGYNGYREKLKIIEKIMKKFDESGIIDMRFKNNIFFIKEEKWLN